MIPLLYQMNNTSQFYHDKFAMVLLDAAILQRALFVEEKRKQPIIREEIREKVELVLGDGAFLFVAW